MKGRNCFCADGRQYRKLSGYSNKAISLCRQKKTAIERNVSKQKHGQSPIAENEVAADAFALKHLASGEQAHGPARGTGATNFANVVGF